ncbi:hypothetical protein AMR72_15125 [Flavobacterium psychrophilum]|nr:hypothetical protein AMR72_15125 [Flavobacterium psychrophilum]AOE53731.1 hypothetical protein ALW18_15115 [Flavobacterium psychrophilum]
MKKLLLIFIAAAVVFACSDDDNSNANNGGNGSDEIFITFKANGTTYTMEPASSTSLKFRVSADQGLDSTYRDITLVMPVEYSIGAHTITDAPSNLEAYEASYSQGDVTIDGTNGTLTITALNEDYIEGTFNFTGNDSDGNSFNITNGSFRAYR